MQKTLRLIAILLLLMLMAALIYSRAHPIIGVKHDNAVEDSIARSERVAEIAAESKLAAHELAPEDVTRAMQPSALGTEAEPVVVKLLESSHADEIAARNRDREIALGIERNTERLAAATLSQNLLMMVQSVFLFLSLIVFYRLMEHARKIALTLSSQGESALSRPNESLRKSE